MATHALNAAEFIKNPERTRWHDESLWFVRMKRDKQAQSVPEWEYLRDCASNIKQHTVSRWGDYLEQFERNATRLGAKVHWAKDAAEHNEIVNDILKSHEVRRVVKSKSMLTEECHLNPFLERHGYEVVDTDLGERIVQLRKEHPSHIVLPAIHIKKEEVSELFHEHLGTEAGNNDPTYLTRAARQHLREQFLAADAGITGVNFAVAETGGIVICTNEGNADLGASLPKVHIASMGLEKLIPRASDLAVFTRLLARSATGQPITTYTSHFHGPVEGGELHIILVDNGRSEIASDPLYKEALKCIRCGACMNTCPVYRRSGGHSYGTTVPGPIGSVLNPLMDAKSHADLPNACSLCGSCTDVCPVKIPLHHQLLAFRKEIKAQGHLPWTKRVGMWGLGKLLGSPALYQLVGKTSRFVVPKLPRWSIYHGLNPWGKQREMPEMPKQSFREMWRKELKNGPSEN
ncbi:lactate utilization protein B [Stratiformator vulcanicus]|uniref:Lactate utilization protein B n=1 Tax=Stratiformator vulcanicus TaxID=2527980 RepID=A0A517QX44_9PLAN|nr:lactate utilization protein B [Stratiformator vulcanicus]QDT36229.1 Lactate utilization protein B [Stratiformator vulcanicus]